MNSGILWCPHCRNPHRLGERYCPVTGKPLDSRVHHSSTVARPHPLIGTMIDGKYEIVRRIGAGGMGEVFEAQNHVLRRSVAIKIVTNARVDAADRLRREAEVIASVQHPNICDVYDVGTMPDGSPYLVLERLTGDTLESARRRPLRVSRIVEIFLQILSALQHAHASGIVHRDLKPANVFLVERVGCLPLVKVLDFGFAKDISGRLRGMTRPGKTCGTPQYMSPEQLCARPLDGRSDLFSVGIILFEMLTRRHPFEGGSMVETTLRIVHEPPSDLPRLRKKAAPLEALILKALAKHPRNRFGSAIEMQTALAEIELPEDEAPASSDSQSIPTIKASDGSRSSS
jgi:eukaryotic-like serine/threonine-protein kinase